LTKSNQATDIAVAKFDYIVVLLADLELESLWEEAAIAERRILIKDLPDSVRFYSDGFTLQAARVPLIMMTS